MLNLAHAEQMQTAANLNSKRIQSERCELKDLNPTDRRYAQEALRRRVDCNPNISRGYACHAELGEGKTKLAPGEAIRFEAVEQLLHTRRILRREPVQTTQVAKNQEPCSESFTVAMQEDMAFVICHV